MTMAGGRGTTTGAVLEAMVLPALRLKITPDWITAIRVVSAPQRMVSMEFLLSSSGFSSTFTCIVEPDTLVVHQPWSEVVTETVPGASTTMEPCEAEAGKTTSWLMILMDDSCVYSISPSSHEA